MGHENRYLILNALQPEAFLKPEDFETPFDKSFPHRAEEQYATGLRISSESRRVIICANGTWAAEGKNGSYTTSYEGIGYHSHTAALLRGFLEGTAELVVNRYHRETGLSCTVIKPAGPLQWKKS